ncbi:unnamed protein product [Calypogeia fissa]
MEGIQPFAWRGANHHRRLQPKYQKIELRGESGGGGGGGGVSYVPRPRRKTSSGAKTLRIMRKRSRGLRISKLRISMLSPLSLLRRLRDAYVRLTAKLTSPCTSPLGSGAAATSRSRSSSKGDHNKIEPAAAAVMTEGDLIWLEYLNRDTGLSAMSRFTMW